MFLAYIPLIAWTLLILLQCDSRSVFSSDPVLAYSDELSKWSYFFVSFPPCVNDFVLNQIENRSFTSPGISLQLLVCIVVHFDENLQKKQCVLDKYHTGRVVTTFQDVSADIFDYTLILSVYGDIDDAKSDRSLDRIVVYHNKLTVSPVRWNRNQIDFENSFWARGQLFRDEKCVQLQHSIRDSNFDIRFDTSQDDDFHELKTLRFNTLHDEPIDLRVHAIDLISSAHIDPKSARSILEYLRQVNVHITNDDNKYEFRLEIPNGTGDHWSDIDFDPYLVASELNHPTNLHFSNTGRSYGTFVIEIVTTFFIANNSDEIVPIHIKDSIIVDVLPSLGTLTLTNSVRYYSGYWYQNNATIVQLIKESFRSILRDKDKDKGKEHGFNLEHLMKHNKTLDVCLLFHDRIDGQKLKMLDLYRTLTSNQFRKYKSNSNINTYHFKFVIDGVIDDSQNSTLSFLRLLERERALIDKDERNRLSVFQGSHQFNFDVPYYSAEISTETIENIAGRDAKTIIASLYRAPGMVLTAFNITSLRKFIRFKLSEFPHLSNIIPSAAIEGSMESEVLFLSKQVFPDQNHKNSILISSFAEFASIHLRLCKFSIDCIPFEYMKQIWRQMISPFIVQDNSTSSLMHCDFFFHGNENSPVSAVVADIAILLNAKSITELTNGSPHYSLKSHVIVSESNYVRNSPEVQYFENEVLKSKTMIEFGHSHDSRSNAVVVIPNGITELVTMDQVLSKSNDMPNSLRVGFIARISSEKSVMLFVEFMKELILMCQSTSQNRPLPRMSFSIIGDGPLKHTLEAFTNLWFSRIKSNSKRFHFDEFDESEGSIRFGYKSKRLSVEINWLGWMEKGALTQYLADGNVDIIVNTGIWTEPFNNQNLHILSLNKSLLVTFAVGGMGEYIYPLANSFSRRQRTDYMTENLNERNLMQLLSTIDSKEFGVVVKERLCSFYTGLQLNVKLEGPNSFLSKLNEFINDQRFFAESTNETWNFKFDADSYCCETQKMDDSDTKLLRIEPFEVAANAIIVHISTGLGIANAVYFAFQETELRKTMKHNGALLSRTWFSSLRTAYFYEQIFEELYQFQ